MILQHVLKIKNHFQYENSHGVRTYNEKSCFWSQNEKTVPSSAEFGGKENLNWVATGGVIQDFFMDFLQVPQYLTFEI